MNRVKRNTYTMTANLLPFAVSTRSGRIQFDNADLFTLERSDIVSPEEMGGINVVYAPRDYLPDEDPRRPQQPPPPQRDHTDTDDMLPAEAPEGRSYSQRPYLVLIILGVRVAHITRREYDMLTPLLRKLADACMRLQKTD